jgi:hypothetical protein
MGSVVPVNPLSAQAHMPSRPSGAGKEKQTTKNEGGSGRDRGPPGERANLQARRHAKNPLRPTFVGCLGSRRMVKSALTPGHQPELLRIFPRIGKNLWVIHRAPVLRCNEIKAQVFHQ